MCVARELPASYDAGLNDAPVSAAQAAIDRLDAAVAALGQVDWSRESADTVRKASVVLQRTVNSVSAQALRPLSSSNAGRRTSLTEQ